MIPTATCQYCGWQGTADECGALENAWERVRPGDPMPAGECPKCNASALLDEPEPSLRLVTTREPECATHVPFRSVAQALARITDIANRERDAIAAFEYERVTACQELMHPGKS